MAAERNQCSHGLSFPVRLAIGVAAVLLLGGIYYFNRDALTLENLAARQNEVVAFQHHHPWLMVVVAYLLYTVVTGLSLPGAAIMTLLYSWFLQQAYPGITGLLTGIVLVSFASTSGASIAFLISRFLFHDIVRQRFDKHLKNQGGFVE